jgi:O-antigen ligase
MLRLLLVTIPLTLFIALFTLSAYLATSASYDPLLVGDSFKAILLSFALFIFIVYFLTTRPFTRFLTLVLILVGGMFALLFISQFAYNLYHDTPSFILSLGRITTLLPDLKLTQLHPNAVATFLEGIIPLSIAFFLRRQQMNARLFSGVMIALMFYALLLTFSRGAFVGLFAALLAFLIAMFLKRLSRPVAYILILGVLAVVGVGVVALLTVDTSTAPPLVASIFRTADSRLTLYRNALYLARDYAFTGIGLGDTFSMVYARYSLLIQVPFLTYPHNLPLAVWLNQGLLGIIALTGIIITFYLFVARVIRLTKPGPLFHGAWLGVTATLAHGLTDARQYTESPWVMPILFIMITLTVALGLIELDEERVAISRWRTLRTWAAAAAAFVLVGVVISPRLNTFQAAWYTNQGALEETRGELEPNITDEARKSLYTEAQLQYVAALQADPTYAPASRRLGNLFVQRGNYDDAVPLLEAAYAAEPNNPAAVKGLGLAYVWVGRLEDAERLLLQLPSDAKIEDEMYTWGYFRRDQQDQPLLAAYAWETGQMLGDKLEVPIWLLIGDTYLEANALDRARAAYEHVLGVEPDNQQAIEGLAAAV